MSGIRALLVPALVSVVVAGAGGTAEAQYGFVPRYNWGFYGSPASLASANIHAQADFLRAYGEASVDLAVARDINAQAVAKEIENSIAMVNAYWERKTIGEIERYKRLYHHLDSQKLQNSKIWDRVKNHPELAFPQIQNGVAPNWLLARLSTTILAYDFAGGGASADMLVQLTLSKEDLHQLRLRQHVPNGQNLIFRADEGTAVNTDWWPYALAGADFNDYRFAFDRAKEKVVEEAQNGRVSPDAINEMAAALFDIQQAFDLKFAGGIKTEKSYGSRMATWNHYNTAKRFLQGLAGEIRRLEHTQKPTAFDGSLRFEGDNLVALITYMSRHGLDFAPAEPGDEPAYHKVFTMMRDMYVTVADEDEALKPVERNRNIGEK